MFTKEDYNRLPIDVVVNLINQLEEERDMYRDKWRKVGKMYGTSTIHVTTQKEFKRQKQKQTVQECKCIILYYYNYVY